MPTTRWSSACALSSEQKTDMIRDGEQAKALLTEVQRRLDAFHSPSFDRETVEGLLLIISAQGRKIRELGRHGPTAGIAGSASAPAGGDHSGGEAGRRDEEQERR